MKIDLILGLLICNCRFIQVAATGSLIGHLANPLLVLPLKPATVANSSSVPKSAETAKLSNLVGAGYQAFEDSVLKKLQKVCHLLVPLSQFNLFQAAFFFILS